MFYHEWYAMGWNDFVAGEKRTFDDPDEFQKHYLRGWEEAKEKLRKKKWF
jgi:hypothetical protein